MKCLECGGRYRELTGDLQMVDKYVGEYLVRGVSYSECGGCGQKLFPLETAEIIESQRRKRMDELLGQRPISAFLSASETAKLLGISRQALHKHRRIRRGFIFQIVFSGDIVYLKESVERFKTKGDGRFSLITTFGQGGGDYLGPEESSRLTTEYAVVANHHTYTTEKPQFLWWNQTSPKKEVYHGDR